MIDNSRHGFEFFHDFSGSLALLSAVDDYIARGLILRIPDFGFECSKCGMVRQHGHTMIRHFGSKHGHAVYKCPFCDLVYKTEDSRQSHVKRTHKMNVSCKEIREMSA